MELIHIFALAIIQGVTEFLPVSSSAHLILTPYFFGFHDQGLALDVAVHLGSLFAVLAYFRKDIIALTIAWGKSTIQQQHSQDSWLAWNIIIATLPVIIAGLLLQSFVKDELRSPWLIAYTTIFFGLLLAWADWQGKKAKTLHSLSISKALLIGFSQVFALIPGTSRSGVTMTAGLVLGMTREAAARFSFLLSIPAIFGASLLVLVDLAQSTQTVIWFDLIVGVLFSAISAYFCIRLFLQLINKIGMWPFVIYRMLLGGLIFFASSMFPPTT